VQRWDTQCAGIDKQPKRCLLLVSIEAITIVKHHQGHAVFQTPGQALAGMEPGDTPALALKLKSQGLQ
jgi:hypothetical protein